MNRKNKNRLTKVRLKKQRKRTSAFYFEKYFKRKLKKINLWDPGPTPK